MQNESATYGLASGFSGLKVANARRAPPLRDPADREHEIQNSLATPTNSTEMSDVEDASTSTILQTQTLGGQITPHAHPSEAGKPLYFLGAFRDTELHLTPITGTVQMRPQFHHLDAEDQRETLYTSRVGASENPNHAFNTPDLPRQVHQSYRPATINPKGELEVREAEMRGALHSAAEEQWVKLGYVDEDEGAAFGVWEERMFLGDVVGAKRLRSQMGNEEFLDAVSAPGRESPTRRRRRGPRRRDVVDLEEGEGDGEGGEGGG